jgi:hypothetical protein
MAGFFSLNPQVFSASMVCVCVYEVRTMNLHTESASVTVRFFVLKRRWVSYL